MRSCRTRRAHVARLVPAGKRTTDQGGYLTRPGRYGAGLTVAGTVPDVRRLPPSPAALRRRTLVLMRRVGQGCGLVKQGAVG